MIKYVCHIDTLLRIRLPTLPTSFDIFQDARVFPVQIFTFCSCLFVGLFDAIKGRAISATIQLT